MNRISKNCDIMKWPNLKIIGIEEGTEIQTKGMNNKFNEILSENFQTWKMQGKIKYKKHTEHQVHNITADSQQDTLQ